MEMSRRRTRTKRRRGQWGSRKKKNRMEGFKEGDIEEEEAEGRVKRRKGNVGTKGEYVRAVSTYIPVRHQEETLSTFELCHCVGEKQLEFLVVIVFIVIILVILVAVVFSLLILVLSTTSSLSCYCC